jgi:hypothetical protein
VNSRERSNSKGRSISKVLPPRILRGSGRQIRSRAPTVYERSAPGGRHLQQLEISDCDARHDPGFGRLREAHILRLQSPSSLRHTTTANSATNVAGTLSIPDYPLQALRLLSKATAAALRFMGTRVLRALRRSRQQHRVLALAKQASPT